MITQKPRLKSICFVIPAGYLVLARHTKQKGVGGSEVQQTILAREFARRNYQVSMITRTDGDDGEIIDNVEVYSAFKDSFAIPKTKTLIKYWQLWQTMTRADADLYYVQNCSAYLGVVAAFAKLKGRHSIYCGASDYDFIPELPYLTKRTEVFLYRSGLKNVTKVIAQSPRQVVACRQAFNIDAELIRSAYGHKGADGARDGVILWAGNIKDIKRPELFVELARLCPEYKFRMIGSGAPAAVQSVRTLAQGLTNIEFTGFVPYAEVEKYFDGASIIINTSVTEGFPNTFLQAWSRGIPSVSFFDPDTRIGNRAVGQVVESIDGMAARVRELKTSESAWRSRSEDCRRYFSETFRLEDVCDQYERLFERMVLAKREK